MKEWYQRPQDRCGCAAHEPPKPACGFLMQRILGKGQLHRRQKCYSLCPCPIPCESRGTLQLLDVAVCGQPKWEEIPCHERGSLILHVTVPLCLRIRDENGCVFTAESSLEEQLKIRLSCRDEEIWRGQILVQAAVRFCGRSCQGQDGCFDAPLELFLDGYMLAPCTMGVPSAPSCPEPKPWYPKPSFDPWRDR